MLQPITCTVTYIGLMQRLSEQREVEIIVLGPPLAGG